MSKNVKTYQMYSDGKVVTETFDGSRGVPLEEAMLLVNRWNGTVGLQWDTRYWLVLS